MAPPYKRIRLLIYTHDTQEGLELQRLHDTREKYLHSASSAARLGAMRLESFELNPLRMTVLELLRLFWREAKHD